MGYFNVCACNRDKVKCAYGMGVNSPVGCISRVGNIVSKVSYLVLPPRRSL